MKTATKHSRKFLTECLKDVAPNNTFKVVVVEDGYAVKAYDTRWDGGTHNDYYWYGTEDHVLGGSGVSEGGEIRVTPMNAVVVHSHFCGKD